jgi:WD40 repeat protein/serine/threonine protein kinase
MLSQIIYDFEAAHQRGDTPCVQDFVKPDAASRTQLLGELVRVDLEYRHKRGLPISVDDYLSPFPDLIHDEELLLEVIEAEHRQRRERGDIPVLEKYARRFPALAERLADRLTGATLGAGAMGGSRATAAPLPQVPGYEMLAVLGAGGMGVVYQARHIKLQRIVALKMIKGGTQVSADDLQRFRTEGEAVGRLQHPNVVQIHEVGEHHGLPFFTLEYCGGGSLASKLNGTPLPAMAAARLTETLARAMAAAHQKQIVHRDLKPHNVLLAEGGVPKITDFGLAKKLDAGAHQTQGGAILGTPSYMAPEQARGELEGVGPLADVYALGAILYEMLTGRPPFKAAKPLDTVLQVLSHEPVAVRRLQPKVPRDLETICLKCLRKEPAKRYTMALELAEDLRRFLGGEPIQARPVGKLERFWRWCQRNPQVAALAAAVAVALVAGTAVAWYLALRAEDRAQEAVRQTQRAEEALALMQTSKGVLALEQGNLLGLLDVLEGRRRATLGENQQAYSRLWSGWHAACAGKLVQVVGQDDGGLITVAFSKDGRSLLTATRKTARVWKTTTGQPKTKALPRSHPHEQQVELSPDGRHVVIQTDRELAQVVEIESGSVVASLKHMDLYRFQLAGADGNLVAMVYGSQVSLCELPSLQPRGEPLQHDAQVVMFAISANGKQLAAVLHLRREVQLWNLDTGTSRQIKVEHAVGALALSKDGKFLATTGKSGEDTNVRLWDTTTGLCMGEPMPHGEDVKEIVFSPDGRLLATAAFDGAVRLWHCDTGQPHGRPLRHDGPVVAVAFDPSGRWLASGSYDNTARVWEVETGKLVGWPLPHQGIVNAVAFAPPDGKLLATASADGTARLWDWSPLHPEEETQHNHRVWGVAFAPDGQFWASCSEDALTCLRQLGHASERWLVPPRRERPWPYKALGLAFHPDKCHLVSAGPGLFQCWSVPAGEKLAQRWLLPSCRHVAISPDGQWLAAGGTEGPLIYRWHEHGKGQMIGPRPHGVEVLAFHPKDANLLAVAGNGEEVNEVYLWNVQAGKVHGPPLDHGARVDAMAISPDGKMLATGGRDQTIRFWNLETHQAIGTPIRLPAYANALAFSPSSRLLASAEAGGLVHVWEVTTRLRYGPALPHGGFASCVAFSPDGRWLATGSFDKKARLWALPLLTDNLVLEEMQQRTALALGARLNAQGLVETIPWQEWQKLRKVQKLREAPDRH